MISTVISYSVGNVAEMKVSFTHTALTLEIQHMAKNSERHKNRMARPHGCQRNIGWLSP